MRVVTLLLLLAPSLSTVVTSHAADTQEECAAKFSESGSFFSGKQYKTSASLPGVKTGIAFKRAYASTVTKSRRPTKRSASFLPHSKFLIRKAAKPHH